MMNKIFLVKYYLDPREREHVEIREKEKPAMRQSKELLNQTNLMQQEPTLDTYWKL